MFDVDADFMSAKVVLDLNILVEPKHVFDLRNHICSEFSKSQQALRMQLILPCHAVNCIAGERACLHT